MSLRLGAFAMFVVGCGARTELAEPADPGPAGSAADASADAPTMEIGPDRSAEYCDAIFAVKDVKDVPLCGIDACSADFSEAEADAVARCVVSRCLEVPSFCGQIRLDLGGTPRSCAWGYSVESPLGRGCVNWLLTRTRWPCLEGRPRAYFPNTCG